MESARSRENDLGNATIVDQNVSCGGIGNSTYSRGMIAVDGNPPLISRRGGKKNEENKSSRYQSKQLTMIFAILPVGVFLRRQSPLSIIFYDLKRHREIRPYLNSSRWRGFPGEKSDSKTAIKKPSSERVGVLTRQSVKRTQADSLFYGIKKIKK